MAEGIEKLVEVFAKFLERGAGEIVVSLFIIAIGVALFKTGLAEEGRALIYFASGVLARCLGVSTISAKLQSRSPGVTEIAKRD